MSGWFRRASTVRSNVRVAWTLAATLLFNLETIGGYRENVTWSISSNSMRIVGLGTKRRYLCQLDMGGRYFSKGYRIPSLALRAHLTPG